MANSAGKLALDIEQLKKCHKDLEKQKTTAEANLKTATEQLDALKEEARSRYDTDDPAQLKTLLQQMKDENERKRREYQSHLEQIQSRLAEIELQYSSGRKQE